VYILWERESYGPISLTETKRT